MAYINTINESEVIKRNRVPLLLYFENKKMQVLTVLNYSPSFRLLLYLPRPCGCTRTTTPAHTETHTHNTDTCMRAQHTHIQHAHVHTPLPWAEGAPFFTPPPPTLDVLKWRVTWLHLPSNWVSVCSQSMPGGEQWKTHHRILSSGLGWKMDQWTLLSPFILLWTLITDRWEVRYNQLLKDNVLTRGEKTKLGLP